MPLKYEQTRDSIASGDVLLFAGHGFWSSLIRWRTSSRITHAGFCAWWGPRLLVLEAKEKIGVRVYPLSEYLRDNSYQVYWYKLDDPAIIRSEVYHAALEQIGKRYASWRQFWRSWIANPFKWTTDTDADRFHCSEYVWGCLQVGASAGHELLEQEPPKVSPAKLVFLPSLRNMGRIVE